MEAKRKLEQERKEAKERHEKFMINLFDNENERSILTKPRTANPTKGKIVNGPISERKEEEESDGPAPPKPRRLRTNSDQQDLLLSISDASFAKDDFKLPPI
mmetsp:Transcript_30619/g.40743  ORF Transcript_30619/g.40743 Transcript_30619/m.40743 type:complete len:102 (-) Transcript_30619:425-730(-)|eukprot:CAMPEP_0185592022 /NCGR_PEP_ID=MMETSP0434-20130131/66568_1 /TAXON_ID=626734 ORGANISM="Favella taraikaensis, Strain Fe Narragansett Bay" /NCGR_SAMPLE_ID=MMETSP0434 /ASSEMBLY_ACC=CAM_ASM_000379 /LENGTH=101 /DNA_ID=CAMNT_0028217503 /DNA_START=168 /DNA_END=473 /DNA_ORIENTATION=+